MDDYQVILTPRTFMMTSNDWHICVITPSGLEIWDVSPYRWTAKLKARWIVRRHRNGGYKDHRQAESYPIKHTGGGWFNK